MSWNSDWLENKNVTLWSDRRNQDSRELIERIHQNHRKNKQKQLKTMKQKIIFFVKTTQFWVIICAIGIWSQFIFTLLSSEKGVQSVYVTGGDIDASVSNTVEIEGSVSVDDQVDVNLSAINGYDNCFYNNTLKHPNDYYRIPIAGY